MCDVIRIERSIHAYIDKENFAGGYLSLIPHREADGRVYVWAHWRHRPFAYLNGRRGGTVVTLIESMDEGNRRSREAG